MKDAWLQEKKVFHDISPILYSTYLNTDVNIVNDFLDSTLCVKFDCMNACIRGTRHAKKTSVFNMVIFQAV